MQDSCMIPTVLLKNIRNWAELFSILYGPGEWQEIQDGCSQIGSLYY